MLVLGTFAAIALMLAVAGIYAVISYAVAQRRREIGIRLALGATPAAVRRMVFASATRAIVPGLLVGTGLALAGARALSTLLYGVSPFDAVTLVSSIVALAVAAWLSSALPAMRATRVDPVIAMRAE
jgi:ABC-type antimicrobial peptide transport system permease subunit